MAQSRLGDFSSPSDDENEDTAETTSITSDTPSTATSTDTANHTSNETSDSDETCVINIDESELGKSETVYIGRGGKGKGMHVIDTPAGYYSQFGNPHPANGDTCPICDTTHTREESIELYRAEFAHRVKHDPEFRAEVEALHGETLACWCKPELCHGDVIVAYLRGELDVDAWADTFEVQSIGDVAESQYDQIPIWIDVELPEDWNPDEYESEPSKEECVVIGSEWSCVGDRPSTPLYDPVNDELEWFCKVHAREFLDSDKHRHRKWVDVSAEYPRLLQD